MSNLNNRNNNIYQSVKVLIDSEYRNDPTQDNITNFTYDLDKTIDRVTRIYVESAQVPYTFYSTRDGQNTLVVLDNAATQYNITIPPGNYNSNTMAVTLKQLLDATIMGGHEPWTVTFNSATFKFTIQASGGNNFQILVPYVQDPNIPLDPSNPAPIQNPIPDPTNIGPYLGFNVDSATANTNTGDGSIDLSGPKYLVLKSAIIGENRGYTTAIADKLVPDDLGSNVLSAADQIIHTIPVNTNPGGMIIDITPEPRYNILGFKTSFKDGMDFILEDDKGNILDLNGNNWAVQLVFELR